MSWCFFCRRYKHRKNKCDLCKRYCCKYCTKLCLKCEKGVCQLCFKECSISGGCPDDVCDECQDVCESCNIKIQHRPSHTCKICSRLICENRGCFKNCNSCHIFVCRFCIGYFEIDYGDFTREIEVVCKNCIK